MKKRNLLFLALPILSLLPTTSCATYSLVVFNWGEYIDMDRVRQFEDEHNCRINYITADSNENLLSKLDTTYFDICFPSEYAIEELAKKDMIRPIDYSRIPNLNIEEDLVPSLKSALDNLKQDTLGKEGFDLLKYAIPYTWGLIGLLYDTTKISPEEIEADGWEALRKTKNADGTDRKVVMYDTARDVLSVALVAQGKDFVEVSDEDLELGVNWLKGQTKTINTLAYKTEEILDDMPNKKYDICFTYIGDAIYSMTSVLDDEGENDYEHYAFYIPESIGPTRSDIYVDAMCMAKNSKNEELAYEFLNFMNEHDVLYDNSIYTGYTSPIQTIYDEITSEYSEYEEGPGSFYDVADTYRIVATDKDRFYRYDTELKTKLEEAWINVKFDL